MSRHERYETRDRTYSNWHRYACSDEAFMIDVDGLESCDDRRCRLPLLLVETARDVGQSVKPATALVGLAKAANIPAVILLWTPSELWVPDPPHCECQRTKRAIDGCDHGIGGFRARHIAPEDKPWVKVDAAAIARWINSIHAAHRVSHHSTIAMRRAATTRAELHLADPPPKTDGEWDDVVTVRPPDYVPPAKGGAA